MNVSCIKAASLRVAFLKLQKRLSEIVCGSSVWRAVSAKLDLIIKTLSELENAREVAKDETFKVAVCGHFSTGKSSFINAIIGTELCPVDTEITTKASTRFLYGAPAIYEVGGRKRKISISDYQRIVRGRGGNRTKVSFEVYLDNPILQKFIFIDTPGRGADDGVVGDDDGEDYGRVSGPSSDDQASIAACEEADCIIYLSHPKNIHDEDEEFLQSDVACKKPVLVVMPKVDRLKDDAEQLISTYQERVGALRKINPSLSALYCCGGFGKKKKAPEVKRDSIERLLGGLDALYSATIQARENQHAAWERQRKNTIRNLNRHVSEIEAAVLALHLSSEDVKEFDENLKQYYSAEDGACQWINAFIKECNDMISHFRDRASSYCYRKEYNLFSNRAAIDDEKIQAKIDSCVTDMIETVVERLRTVLVTKVNDTEAFKKAKECAEKLGCCVREFAAGAMKWWGVDFHTWPGDTWYWSNDDVDRVGRRAVRDWANGVLVQNIQKITKTKAPATCAQEIEKVVSGAVAGYVGLRRSRLAFLTNLKLSLVSLKKEV